MSPHFEYNLLEVVTLLLLLITLVGIMMGGIITAERYSDELPTKRLGFAALLGFAVICLIFAGLATRAEQLKGSYFYDEHVTRSTPEPYWHSRDTPREDR